MGQKRTTQRVLVMNTYEVQAYDMMSAQVATVFMSHGCQQVLGKILKMPNGDEIRCTTVEFQSVHIDDYKRRYEEAEKERREAIAALDILMQASQSVIDECIETKGELDWGANELRMAINTILRKDPTCPPPSTNQS